MTIDIELTSYPGLDERIVVVRAGEEVDCVFVRTERFAVLVDTLATPALCARALECLEPHRRGLPLVVINSHMDWDHFWGNCALGPVPIIAHETALSRLHDGSAAQVLREKQAVEPRFQGVEIIPPTITFSGESVVLHGGDLTLELIHTPGHTPDHLAIWIPELQVCLAVDAVEAPIPEVWSASASDLSQLCLSLKRIRRLNPRHLIVAHGQTRDPATVDRNLAYFQQLSDAVATLDPASLPVPALNEQPLFRAEAFFTLPEDMPEETRAFYRRCHASNLNAAQTARREGVAFI